VLSGCSIRGLHGDGKERGKVDALGRVQDFDAVESVILVEVQIDVFIDDFGVHLALAFAELDVQEIVFRVVGNLHQLIHRP